MFKLIQNIHLYAPEDRGMNDLLICGEKIACIAPHIDIRGLEVEVIDGAGMNAAPGCIDQHVHIIGGGGQTGYFSLAPEVPLSRLLACGTTTVVAPSGNHR